MTTRAPHIRAVLAALLTVGLLLVPVTGATAGDDDSITVADGAGDAGYRPSLVLDATGRPVVAHTQFSQLRLRLLHCNDPNCAGSGDTVSTPDPDDGRGGAPSLALDAAGNPVVTYTRFLGPLQVLHCNDPNCTGGDESITTPDPGRTAGSSSIVLDDAGNPVVAYYDSGGGDLRILRCNDPNCAGGGESLTSPDTIGDVGDNPSLVLDAAGNPVVSYYDRTRTELRILHCDDPNCAPGGNSLIAGDTDGDVGFFSSLALDGAGNPVVAYYDGTNGDLKLLRCDDPDCAGSGDSIRRVDSTGDVGLGPSLVLDADDNPVVSYYDRTNEDLRLLHCNDPRCAGFGDTVTVADSAGSVGIASSLALDAKGNPVVAYSDLTNQSGDGSDLKLLHCNDPDCGDARPVVTFTDDDDSVFEDDIEELAAADVTRGCNPPSNTRFCPDDPVTREQLAAFLNRALDLPAAAERFTDVPDDDTFAKDIGALAASDITRGCNPPANTRFCPDALVTREQLAAFLNRALDLLPADEQFTDVPDDDTFARDIGALAASDITRGCNPPRNTRFCPDEPVTRGQLAAFFVRAGLT